VLHVEDPLLDRAARAAGVELADETRAELGRFMQGAFPAGDWAPAHHVITGAAVEAICHIATRERADIIALGARGMSGVQRAVFGSTAEGVLRKADTSVLVVPEEWTPPRPDLNDLSGVGPIVAGLELTPSAIEAARIAGLLAQLLDTTFEVRHVVPPMPVLQRWSAHAETAVAARITAARAEIQSALRYLDVPPSVVGVDSGSIAEQLAAAVATAPGRHPMLVLGRRPHADRGGAPGSTAYRVLSLATAPVLMCLPEA
jgi:nucleotide-binding universal stress UspA family protein